MFSFFKRKKKELKPMYKNYNIGKTVVTILDLSDHEHIATFEGYVFIDVAISGSWGWDIKLKHYNKLVSANEYLDWYLNKVYAKSQLFELDNGNHIPSHRIKLIKVNEEVELMKEYIVPFDSDEYCDHNFKFKAACGKNDTCFTCSKCFLHKIDNSGV